MRKAKKAVRKAAEARERAKAKKAARTKRAVAQEGNSSGDRKAPAPVTATGFNWVRSESGVFIPNVQSESPCTPEISKACVEAGFPPYEELPPRLFKYAPPDWTRIWATLADGLVYFASPLAFNDPYDSRIFLAKTPEEMKKAIRRANANIEKHGKAGHDVSEFAPGEERDRHQAAILANHESVSKGLADKFPRVTNLGICCLSGKCDSLPMWAHYAKDHKGVCFVFNPYVRGASAPEAGIGCFPLSHVWRVRYRRKMRKWNLKTGWMRPFFEKSGEWAYEKE